MNDRIKRIAGTAGLYLPLAALLIGLLILSISVPSMVQSSAPVPMQHTFTGEYSWDRENWYTLDDSADLDALNGDLYLRGSLGAKIWEGGQLYFFSNHISGEIYVNGELCYADILMEMERYGIGIQPAMCGRGWGVWYFRDGLPENAEVEIHLKNPHSFGNKSAYRDFLSTLYSMNDGPELLQVSMAGHTRPQTGIGIVLALVAAMLLGASAAGAVMRFPVSGRIARLGLMAAFAGGYFVLDTIGLSFWSENNLLNTYGRQICMMYAVYFLGLVCRDELKGRACGWPGLRWRFRR